MFDKSISQKQKQTLINFKLTSVSLINFIQKIQNKYFTNN